MRKVIGLKVSAVLLGVLAILYLIFDLVEVVRGRVNLNQHILFLMPVVFSFFIAMIVFIERGFLFRSMSESETKSDTSDGADAGVAKK